jgi:capsular polysaccharide biosynthesis protein
MPAMEKVGEITACSQYLAYPAVYQRHLIPDDTFRILSNRWSEECKAIPNTEFHLVRGVYVIDEGLVFTPDAVLVAQTRIDFTDVEVARAEERIINALQSPAPIARYTRGVLCKKRGAKNYGHWLVEMLPKAYWTLRKLNLWDWPMAVHACAPEMAAVIRDSLAVIGVPAEKIIETGSEPVYFEELLLVRGLTEHSLFISPLVMDCMAFIAGTVPLGEPDNLYAVRRPSSFRDFDDEPTAREVLLSNGYRVIECGSLPFLAQVSAFRSARRVTGPMGAALANAVFCRPGTELLVFMPASAREVLYWHIAEAKRLTYHEVRTEESGPVKGDLPWDRALRINSTMMRTILQRLDERRRQPNLELIAAGRAESADKPFLHGD